MIKFYHIILIGFLFITSSCGKAVNKGNLKYEDFKIHLKPNMVRSSVVELFGDPKSETDGGLQMLVYELADSTNVVICCAPTYILYASLQSKKGEMIEKIF